VTSIATGTLLTLGLIALSPTVQVDLLGRPEGWFPLRNPALVTVPLSFAAGILVSLLTARRRPETALEILTYDALARRMHLGAAEE
jgi:cation/acetate symporter